MNAKIFFQYGAIVCLVLIQLGCTSAVLQSAESDIKTYVLDASIDPPTNAKRKCWGWPTVSALGIINLMSGTIRKRTIQWKLVTPLMWRTSVPNSIWKLW